MERITDKQLNALADWINELTDSPLTPWTADEGGIKANIGNYHISRAYGGVCLHRMVNTGGGVTCPIFHGHVTKRELYNSMHAYIKGLRDAQGMRA